MLHPLPVLEVCAIHCA
ncbi:hypothetical protein M3J09_008133 [Ascochyta lentis]